MILAFSFLCLLVNSIYCFNDYYWRDYTGKIPFDAFSAGEDVNNDKTYIGQVLIKDSGIFPTIIYSVGNKDIYAPILGAKKAENFVQILCSPRPEFFKWIPANATDLHLLSLNYDLVRGGLEANKWLNIGRIKHEGDVVVGKVLSGYAGNALMYFVHNAKEMSVSSYEVLTYDGSSVQEIELRILN